jgi:GT2 family glycosyltransferase
MSQTSDTASAGAAPRVSIVTPIFNRREITLAFLKNIEALTYPFVDVTIVDDGSTDGSADAIAAQCPSVRLIRTDGNLWWSKATNIGVTDAIARGARYILTINDDVIVEPDFLSYLVEFAESHPRTLVGATIYDIAAPKKLWYAGGTNGWWSGQMLHRGERDRRPLHWLTGMGTLLPVEVFREIGMYDERHFPQYAGDVDLTMRARTHGFSLAISPRSIVWNKADESVQLIIRRRVTPRTFFLPVLSKKSDAMLSMRITLYARHWPPLLIPVAFVAYYTKFFAKQTVRLLRIRR